MEWISLIAKKIRYTLQFFKITSNSLKFMYNFFFFFAFLSSLVNYDSRNLLSKIQNNLYIFSIRLENTATCLNCVTLPYCSKFIE